jgi:hypothetical protein
MDLFVYTILAVYRICYSNRSIIFGLLKQYSTYTMIVTSTHNIEGREVLRYFDLTSAMTVIKANGFECNSDVA